MHDVIRDMSLWIASKCEVDKWKFFVEAGYGLTKAPDVEKWRNVERMSLMQNKIQSLTKSPDCPHLQTLFLNHNRYLEEIQSDFFQFMPGLKVLSLHENRGVTEVPVGISKLVSLQYLDLSYTNISHLPIELMALKRLKCLDLSRIRIETASCITVPRGLVAGFSKLQILRMLGTCVFVEEVKQSDECLAEELQCLKHLKVLSVSLTSDVALNRFLSANKLHSCLEDMQLQFSWKTKRLNVLSLANFERLSYLELVCGSLEDVEIISVNPGQPCFLSLSHVYVSMCAKLRDMTWLILAPNLKTVNVNRCLQLEEIINEEKLVQVDDTLTPFPKLETLTLWDLQELKSIYWDALPFSCLNEIRVFDCPKLRRLPLNSNSSIAKLGNKITIRGEEKWWKELQWDDESTRNAFLLCFVAAA